ncbi:MAG TPA: D-glycero-beta-D-manno-heptose 1-phosphate adenylyltransferase [Bacteroidota bacterium]|nr:D-glycero-beta-D-manno-heptose 1-phosphate adenylyltransferase [Bacteroidota bacterium]
MGTILRRGELAAVRSRFRDGKKTVVFTNGVFDILHRGHVEYLAKARSLGDVLIVGMNTDASVKRIKGPRRPIVPEQDRAFILSHIDCVDFVCLFTEDTPESLISELVPDVLVKGDDWKPDAIIGRDIVEKAGGRVVTIEFVPDRSTTGIIERILDQCA